METPPSERTQPAAAPQHHGPALPAPWISPATLVVIALFAAVSVLAFRDRSSADLMAVWLAGEAVGMGRPDLLYPPDTAYFSMLPPPDWIAWLTARGYTGDVFPFIYPPLWAWLAARLSAVIAYDGFLRIMSALLPALIGLMLVFAHRLAAPAMRQASYVAGGLALIALTFIGAIALHQNQPQIIVALLVVAAIERSEHGAPRTAGILLALAAAIKVVPVLYALLWLMMRRWRELAAFAVTGAALAALSVAVMGWPAHAAFLRMLGIISDTGLLIRFNYSIGTALMQVFAPDSIVWVPDAMAGANPARAAFGYNVIPLPAAVSLSLKLAQLATVILCGRLLARAATTEERAALWPFAMIAISLTGPLSWSHHYLAPAAFLPMIALRLRPALAAAAAVAILLFLSPLIGVPGLPIAGLRDPIQLTGTLVMIGIAGLFLAIRRRPAAAV